MRLRLGLIKRILAGGTTLLSVSVTIWVMGGATADAAVLSAETPSGPAGSSVLVSGDGYVSGVQVRLCWDDPGCADLGTAVPQGLVTGSFSTQTTIPLSAEPGTYEIHGCQLVPLSGLTCSHTTFEVLADEPVTTTTAPTTTLTSLPTTTASTTVTTPTTLAPTTTIAGERTTSLAPITPTAGEGTTTTLVIVDVLSQGGGETTETTATTEVQAVPGSVSGESTTTSFSAGETSEVGTYTPPTLSGPDPSRPSGDEEGPRLVVEAADDDTSSPQAWLDNPLVFWAMWLIAVVVGGSLATMAAWLFRRHQRRES